MLATSVARRRGALLLVLVLTLAVVLGFAPSPSSAQIRRPPQPPIFRPPQMPQVPRMPQIPHPVMPGQPGGFPKQPSIPTFERVWSCSGCNAELGRGPIKPNLEKCPRCGTRFGNTVAGQMADMRDRMSQMPGHPAGMTPPVGMTPPAGMVPPAGMTPPAQQSPMAPTSGPSTPATMPAPAAPAPSSASPASTADSSSSLRSVAWAGTGLGGLGMMTTLLIFVLRKTVG